ncbi:hypothetical protein O1611_g9885 [Lasiodiplodia mahajangana]|uniref:Uncharacterized protein n=1 Tax=Lasiodiplodia mahajangana TaxID=1108764 RepID=A0ACC2J4B6_9PEZI|nr:hypothetical protein O1611_g9885 [Lasiodiplodia mahajangana]
MRCQPSRLENTWEMWKTRNCGGTSCYDVPSIVGSVVRDVKEALTDEKANPVADVARDEIDWAKKYGGDWMPQIWKDVYEDACCNVDFLSYRLGCGSPQEPRVITTITATPRISGRNTKDIKTKTYN